MNALEFIFFAMMLLFFQNGLYEIKKHAKQSEQYLEWIQEDLSAIRKAKQTEETQ